LQSSVRYCDQPKIHRLTTRHPAAGLLHQLYGVLEFLGNTSHFVNEVVDIHSLLATVIRLCKRAGPQIRRILSHGRIGVDFDFNLEHVSRQLGGLGVDLNSNLDGDGSAGVRACVCEDAADEIPRLYLIV
jgi:hypothetical protein